MKVSFFGNLCSLTAAITCISTFIVFAVPAASAANTIPAQAVGRDVSGTQMVYMRNDGNWDVYLFDLETGAEQKLTDDAGTQGYPAISGNYVVWQDNRAYPGDKSKYDIYLYDRIAGKQKKINQHEGFNHDVEIQGTKVVWLDNSSVNSNIYVYDIVTGEEKRITSDNAQAFGVQLSGDQVAWMDARSGSFDIFSYSLTSGRETQLTSSTANQSEPNITDGKVVWHDYRNGVRQVYMYDLASGKEQRLSTGNQESTLVAAVDGKVLYREEGNANRLIMFDSSNNRKFQFVDVNPDSSNISLADGKLFWTHGSTVSSAALNSIMLPYIVPSAVADIPAQPIGWTDITSEGGSVQSTDSLFSVRVPRGSVSTKIGLKVTEDDITRHANGLPPYYQTVSKPYKVTVNGQLQGAVDIQLQLPQSDGMKLDLHKFVLYRYDDKTQSWKRVRSDFKKFGLATVESGQLGTFVLAYYNAPFDDVKTHWSQDKVEALAAHQVISGYADKQFYPDNLVTRAEFVRMITLALDVVEQPGVAVKFTDTSDHWADHAIRLAAQNGMIFGEDGMFRPDAPITRQEMIAILMRAAKLEKVLADGSALIRFSDSSAIASWAHSAVEQAVQLDLISGRDGKIAPEANTTRAEAATVIYKMLEKQ